MKQQTMVYRPATDDAPRTHVIENEAGAFEWQILDLDDGEAPPTGWRALPVEVLETETSKPKRPKIKLPEDTDGNSDGN